MRNVFANMDVSSKKNMLADFQNRLKTNSGTVKDICAAIGSGNLNPTQIVKSVQGYFDNWLKTLA